jgi:hypothetical protein
MSPEKAAKKCADLLMLAFKDTTRMIRRCRWV